MKTRTKKLVVIGVIVALAAAIAFVVLGKGRTPEACPPEPTVSEEPGERLPAPSELISMLSGAGVAENVPGWSQEQIALVEAALQSDDPEGALVQLLSDPEAPHNLVVWYLGEIGGKRAEEALLETLQKWWRKKRLSRMAVEEYARALEEGTLEAIREDAKLVLPDEEHVKINLWLIQLRLEGLAPLEQVERISQRLDAIQASPEPAHNKWGPGARLIQRLGTLGLRKGFEVLERLVKADLKLGPEPYKSPEHWLPYGTVVWALDQIGDARGLWIVETLYPHLIRPRGTHNYARRVWWRLKLNGTAKDQWPDVLVNCLLTRTPPPAASSVWQGAEEAVKIDAQAAKAAAPSLQEVIIGGNLPELSVSNAFSALRKVGGVESLPFVRTVVRDRSLPPALRAPAAYSLGMYQDPSDLPLLRTVATDVSEPARVRKAAACAALRWPTAEALGVAIAGARIALQEGDEKGLSTILGRIRMFAGGLKASPDDEAFLRTLLEHPSQLIRGRAYFALKKVGSQPPPEPAGLWEGR